VRGLELGLRLPTTPQLRQEHARPQGKILTGGHRKPDGVRGAPQRNPAHTPDRGVLPRVNAIAYHAYRSPDVLQLEEVETPVPLTTNS